MSILLHIQASVRGEAGNSSVLAHRFTDGWKARNPAGGIIFRDLVAEPVPYLDGAGFAAFATAQGQRSAVQQAVVAQSDALIAELREADEVVFAMPMYNFGVPAQVKSYFDYIARVGVTFRYSERGPVGLLENKPVYLMCARGGLYDAFGTDRQTPFIRDFFEMIGLLDLRFVIAEGLNIDPETKLTAMERAIAQVDQLG